MSKALRRAVIGALVLVAFGTAGLMCVRVGERGRYVGAYSTYGAGPEGTRGLYLLAEQLGAQPTRWAEELGRLPDGAMLVALGSCQQVMRRELGRIEREQLHAWVRRGGTLVVAGVPDYLSRDALGVELLSGPGECRPTEGLIAVLDRAEGRRQLRKRETDPDARELDELAQALRDDPYGTYDELLEQAELPEARAAVGVGAPLDGVPLVGIRQPLRIRVDDGAIDGASPFSRSTLMRLDGPDGEPAAVRVDVGEGRVIVLASSSMLQNRDLATQNGGVLFSRLVREHGGPILFDEFHLGVGQRRSLMRYLRQTGVGPVVLQILLLVVFVLWRVGASFGAPARPAPEDPAGTASYVEGVGTLYAKARDPKGAIEILVRRALERIARHHHVASRDAQKIAEALDERRQTDAAEAVRAIERAAASPPARGGLERFTARLDELTRVATA
ncbi:MAG: DUF4350 domain-containing protein [Sandaracinaceae bacterium]|nr:DUF4350 domain-containing protein [Sandaracinaceae bacterium]